VLRRVEVPDRCLYLEVVCWTSSGRQTRTCLLQGWVVEQARVKARDCGGPAAKVSIVPRRASLKSWPERRTRCSWTCRARLKWSPPPPRACALMASSSRSAPASSRCAPCVHCPCASIWACVSCQALTGVGTVPSTASRGLPMKLNAKANNCLLRRSGSNTLSSSRQCKGSCGPCMHGIGAALI